MEDKTVYQLFTGEDVRYRIPIYQRHYVWEAMHWQHLWNDIEEKTNSILEYEGLVQPAAHFTGVIVTRRNENGEVEVVDGQQRLTTFQIILCAIRDICSEKFSGDLDTKNILDDVGELIKNEPNREQAINPELIFKLLPTEGPDRRAFQALVNRLEDSGGLLREAYTDFKGKIESFVECDYERIFALSQTLLFYFKTVEQTLAKDDVAARIFESLNGRGLPLSQFDLLRNNVFLRATDKKNDLYAAYWSHFNTDSDWFSNDFVDDFLLNFLEAKLNRAFNPKSSLFDLYQRSYLNKLRDELNIPMDHDDNPVLVEREFEELQPYSKSYVEISNSSTESPIWFYQFLKDELKIKSWHPLILLLKTELELSAEQEADIFGILESYIVHNMLCYPETPEWIRESNFRELRLKIVDQIHKIGNSFEKIKRATLNILKSEREHPCPDDTQIREALEDAGHHWARALIRYILFKVECKNTNPELTETQLAWSPKLSIEHVMPRKWEAAKEEISGSLSWPVASKSREEYFEHARNRDLFVASIGNLTLLTKALNEACRNSSFLTKTDKHYKSHSRLSLTADIIYDEADNKRPKWDVAEIKNREKKLVDEFYEIWPLAEKF